MDLRTKVIRISVFVGCIIVIGVIGYLAYFILKDTLKPPPKYVVTKNLFIEKDLIDIANLKNMDNIDNCRNLYHSIWNSLYEEKLNGLLGENQIENEIGHSFLMKNLNFAYIEQFIVLANRYFLQSNWNENFLINKSISEIKKDGFVEPNTPIWNSLQGFESSINWYNSVQDCIGGINEVIDLDLYYFNNILSAITKLKNYLNNINCVKNGNKWTELVNAYDNLKNKSESFLHSKITNYISELNRSGNNGIYRDMAFQNFEEVSDEVEQWNNAFNTTSELNSLLQNYRNRIYYFYN
jgi:hypothetical protein